MSDLDDHPFSAANIAYESGAPDASERAWLKWCGDVERILEIKSLDGNQETDGYSIDFAHDAFADGRSAQEYADEVKAALNPAPKI